MPLLDRITPQTIAAALREHLGMEITPDSIRLEHRGWRWVATLPKDTIVFIADSPEHSARLAREGRLLQRLRPRVHFHIPRIHAIDPSFGIEIRGIVPGAQIGGDGRERAFADQPQGRRLAEELGRALAQLHAAITVAEASELGFASSQPILPPADRLETRLEPRLNDPRIASTFAALLERYRSTEVDLADIVLVHGDVWGGNLAVDLATGALNGLFDFEDAGIGDRHLDLMYIHSFGEAFAERACATYTERAHRPISRQRTALYHAIAAFAALADAEDALLAQRRRWVAGVCDGPVARMALS